MPRRLPVRPAKLVGNLFVLFVLLVIALIYYVYVFVMFGPRLISNLFLFLNDMFRQLLRGYSAKLLPFIVLHDTLVLLPGHDH